MKQNTDLTEWLKQNEIKKCPPADAVRPTNDSRYKKADTSSFIYSTEEELLYYVNKCLGKNIIDQD